MLDRLRRNLTFANVTSVLALSIALGTGGAYAAATIGSDDIIDGSLRSIDIQDAQIRTADLGADSVGPAKVADGQLNAADVAKVSGRFAWDPVNLVPGDCDDMTYDTDVNIRGDAILVSPTYVEFRPVYWHGPVSIYWDAQEFVVTICNNGTSDVDPGRTVFSYVVLDN